MKMIDYLIDKSWTQGLHLVKILSYEKDSYGSIYVKTEIQHYFLNDLLYQIKCNDEKFYDEITKLYPEEFL